MDLRRSSKRSSKGGGDPTNERERPFDCCLDVAPDTQRMAGSDRNKQMMILIAAAASALQFNI